MHRDVAERSDHRASNDNSAPLVPGRLLWKGWGLEAKLPERGGNNGSGE
jgi:hypothetical protein